MLPEEVTIWLPFLLVIPVQYGEQPEKMRLVTRLCSAAFSIFNKVHSGPLCEHFNFASSAEKNPGDEMKYFSSSNPPKFLFDRNS